MIESKKTCSPKFKYKEYIMKNGAKVCLYRPEYLYLFPLLIIGIVALVNYLFFDYIPLQYICTGLSIVYLFLYIVSKISGHERINKKMNEKIIDYERKM